MAIPLIPSLVLIAAPIVAWSWEWVGAAISFPPPSIKLQWIGTAAFPVLAIRTLFLANWPKHD